MKIPKILLSKTLFDNNYLIYINDKLLTFFTFGTNIILGTFTDVGSEKRSANTTIHTFGILLRFFIVTWRPNIFGDPSGIFGDLNQIFNGISIDYYSLKSSIQTCDYSSIFIESIGIPEKM